MFPVKEQSNLDLKHEDSSTPIQQPLERFGLFRRVFENTPFSSTPDLDPEVDITRFRRWLNILFYQLNAVGCNLYSEKGVNYKSFRPPRWLQVSLILLYFSNHMLFLRELVNYWWTGNGHVTAIYISFQGESILASLKFAAVSIYTEQIKEMVAMCVAIRGENRCRHTIKLFSSYTRQCGAIVILLFCMYHTAEGLIQLAPSFYVTTYPIPASIPGPLTSNGTIAVAVNYVYQAYFVLVTSAISCCVDALFFSMASEASLRLDVLTTRFEEHRTRNSRNQDECGRVSLGVLSEEHKACLRFIRKLQSTFNGVTSSQFIMSLLIISTSMYSSSTVKDLGSAQHIIPFFTAVLGQLFIYTWFTQVMTDKVNNLTTIMYKYDWISMNAIERKDLIIMMGSTQKKFVFLAGGIIPVSLGTYLQTLRTAYSYYAVMRQKS